MGKSEIVLRLLAKIPKGKVTTYKALAMAANSSPRAIGQIMRRNARPEKYPCFKVIRADGSIGGYEGKMKGATIKRKITLLRKDGIVFDGNRIDKKYIFMFS